MRIFSAFPLINYSCLTGYIIGVADDKHKQLKSATLSAGTAVDAGIITANGAELAARLLGAVGRRVVAAIGVCQKVI